MTKIPFYIIEEHHEAFFIWHYAIVEGFIKKTQNTLLHVDEHSDMMFPVLKTSLKSLNNKEMKQLYEFSYNELTIANFIYPTVYQGIFNDIYWLRQSHKNKALVKKKMSIYSHKGNGKQLILKSKTNFEELFNPDYKTFTMSLITTENSPMTDEAKPSSQSVVLDIDIDYFSCDNTAGEYCEVEITQEAYDDYVNNFYNKARLSVGGTSVKQVDGKYYFCSSLRDDLLSEQLKVSEDVIVERIDALINFLKVNQIQPQLINICRSRFSGYTPNDQWEFIENRLIEKLSGIYEFNPVFISDLLKEGLAVA